ncbi:MAG: transporter substrate-binding domain-containing protein [Treponema sp.]|nr:transporter substrate-binding domain-containing protein [Treponema sp.]
MKRLVLVASTTVLIGAIALSGCAKKNNATSATGVRKIACAHTYSYAPYGYVNDAGKSDGFEVAVLKEIDRLLPQYEFAYHPTSDDDLLIGVESGKYQLGTKGIWKTAERAKKYIFPKQPIGASIIGITFRRENADQIHDLVSFAQFSGKLVPIAPQSAQYDVVVDFNNTHPDTQIQLLPSEIFIITDAYTWVLEGRYDAFFDIKLSYQNNVEKDGAPYHSFASRLAYVPYRGIPTWPLFNKNEQELADAYDTALKTLQDNGTIAALSLKYFGEDVFNFVTD